MYKKVIIVFIMIGFSLTSLMAQRYDKLWKEVREAAEKDLPQTQMKALDRIVQKATKDRAYGHLLKAELQRANVQLLIAPDSIVPTVAALERQAQEAGQQNALLAAVMNSVMGTVYYDQADYLGEGSRLKSRDYFVRSLASVEQLAKTKASALEPMVVKGEDSRIFNNDLLSLLGYHAAANGYWDAYEVLHAYYDKVGNRVASMLTAYEKGDNLDSLLQQYGDLQECGYLAERKLAKMSYRPAEEQLAFAGQALQRWPDYRNANAFRNRQQALTCPQYHVSADRLLCTPSQQAQLQLSDIRNLQWLQVRVWNTHDRKDAFVVKRDYSCHPDYDLFRDTIDLPVLPIGHYKIEVTTDRKDIEAEHADYYVSNLRVLTQHLPKGTIRYVVVDATTGKPVEGARMEFFIHDYTAKKKSVAELKTDIDGTCILESRKHIDSYVVTTPTDTYMPEMSQGWGDYSYYEPRAERRIVQIYTDRKIYRPGQQVHVSLVAFDNKYGLEVKTFGEQQMTLTLRDANNKEIGKQSLVTDSYGTASADFTLPTHGLTGTFSLRTDFGNGYQSIRVEEYKRPTFEVTFEEVKTAYKAGDTVMVKGIARSYAGVPVQGAEVKYKVSRSRAWWWYRHQGGSDELSSGTLQTADDGSFLVPVKLLTGLGENDRSEVFFHFTVSAEVTDQAGESHNGETMLPLGTRPTSLQTDLPDKALDSELREVRFIRRNVAGTEIDGMVTYTIDDEAPRTVKANTPFRLPALGSGRHVLTASCGDNKLTKSFVIFSLDDPRPCVETHDWFFQSAQEFPKEGAATIQIGTSDEDVTVFYSVFSGNEELEHGTFRLSDSNRRLDYTYQEKYGSGLLLTFAWVKDAQTYTHRATISRPLPEKRLNLKWTTFRDRLVPGQKETWTLRITHPDGTPAKAQLMATLYDKSLDQLVPFSWYMDLGLYQTLPSTVWTSNHIPSGTLRGNAMWKDLETKAWSFSSFSDDIHLRTAPLVMEYGVRARGGRPVLMSKAVNSMAAVPEAMVYEEAAMEEKAMMSRADAADAKAADAGQEQQQEPVAQLRENLSETAFFYPALETDASGNVALRFTLPESLTTWNFFGLAHDQQMNNGMLTAEAVAKKDVMIQPNMPRFLREGDEATLTARIMNTSAKTVSGTARLLLIDAETEQVVMEQKVPFTVKAEQTTTATFTIQNDKVQPLVAQGHSMLVCRVLAEGKNFSDGEQHYLALLPNREQVTNTLPFTQNSPGAKEIQLNDLVPSGATLLQQPRWTVEYTNNPAWLMVQALPFLSNAHEDNAISLAASYYANSLGRHIIRQNPSAKNTFAQWKAEQGSETSLQSALEKNQELKSLVLDETPWVADADRETEQKKALANFFDENTMDYQLQRALEGMKRLQNGDGSFSWWKGMPGSPCMTAEVMEFLTRLNLLTTEDGQTTALLNNANRFLSNIVVREVKEMKELEKEGKAVYIHDYHALQWLYLCAVADRKLSSGEQEAKAYLMDYLEKKSRTQSLYAKALMAVVLAKDKELQKAQDYLQSLFEYTVYTEEKGRYYDTPRAGYSWCDYRIPTQTAVIEALQLVGATSGIGSTVGDTPIETVVEEMQRWLLQEKRTQAWDTPINSVNAVFAFLNGRSNTLAPQPPTVFRLGGKEVETPKATAGLGYVKFTLDGHDASKGRNDKEQSLLVVEKTSKGTSWGAVYAQFMQPVTEVADASSGLKVKRELLADASQLKVGDRVKVRITVEADRDYDFVQLVDKRAACLEPVKPLSGYHWGYYIAPKDYATNYYFDRMAKGRHVVETEYYVDRAGTYQTGTCTVQCAYSPEFMAREKATVLKVKSEVKKQ